MAVRRDNVISIMPRQVLIMSSFLIRFTIFQLSSYPIVLTKPSGPRSRPNPHLKELYNRDKFIINLSSLIRIKIVVQWNEDEERKLKNYHINIFLERT